MLGGPQGLLGNAGEELGELLDRWERLLRVSFLNLSFPARCSTENQPGARWTAVDQLLGVLGGGEGSGDQNVQEENQEDDDDDDEQVEEGTEENEEEDEEGEDDIEETTGKERNEQGGQYIDDDDEEEEEDNE